MDRKAVFIFITIFCTVALFGIMQNVSSSTDTDAEVVKATEITASYIVQAKTLDIAKEAVQDVRGEITHELGIIKAVGARLSPKQLAELNKDSRLRIQADRDAEVAGPAPSTFYPTLVGAADLHKKGITGTGVTVAVLDSGFYERQEVSKDPNEQHRVLVQFDAIEGEIIDGEDSGKQKSTDEFGHGSHVTRSSWTTRRMRKATI